MNGGSVAGGRLARAAEFMVVSTARLCAAGVIFSFMARLFYPADLFCHFYIQYSIFILPAAFILTIRGRRRDALIMGLFALYCAYSLAPFLPYRMASGEPAGPGSAQAASPAPAGAGSVRIVSSNVHTANAAHEKVLEMADRLSPDILLLLETNGRWLDAMKPLEKTMPYRITHSSEDNFGMALYSKIMPDTAEIVAAGRLGLPLVTARFTVNGKSFAFYGAHPLPPISRLYKAHRDDYLEWVARAIASAKGRAILAGDLNATPWDPTFTDLLAAAGLSNASGGFGVNATWPALPAPLRIPIDHVLHTKDISVSGIFVGPATGSDHLPIVADIALE